jgi:phage terminase small subunit
MYLSVKLNPQQQKFADEYINTGNAYQSAINAGYSKNYAKNAQEKMVEKGGRVSEYIKERMEKIQKESKGTVADQTEVIEFLTRILRNEETEEVLVNVGNFEQEFKESGISIKDRIKAAELMGKLYSLWTEKLDINSDLTIVFEDDYGD